jgi:NADPH-dependent ferric siderophore reductase
MARITFGGAGPADDLTDLGTDEPDRQVKLYFPRPDQDVPTLPAATADGDVMRWYQSYTAIPEPERPWVRSYTVRAHDRDRATVDVDFVLHEHAGPATRWALAARPGDTLGMFGPSPDFARPVPLTDSIAAAEWVLLAGDETALPAIGTLVEALPAGTHAVAYVEVADRDEEQRLHTRGDLTLHWLHRGTTPPGRGTALLDAVRGADLPTGEPFAWLAGEAGAVRALRRHLTRDRGFAKRAVEFSGNWRLRLSQDDAPTEEDLAEAAERLASAQVQSPPLGPTARGAARPR